MNQHANFANRFRGFLPVVIDVETAGFNAQTDALLEVAAVLLHMDEQGLLKPAKTIHRHIKPFPGANLEAASLAFTGIDPDHPFRNAVDEKDGLKSIFTEVRTALKEAHCHRAILVGHNAFFDLNFIRAAVDRQKIKRNPFHRFSTLDTVSLGALAFGQTVLAKSVKAAKFEFDHAQAHSALYDAERTADLFCSIINSWQELGGWDVTKNAPK